MNTKSRFRSLFEDKTNYVSVAKSQNEFNPSKPGLDMLDNSKDAEDEKTLEQKSKLTDLAITKIKQSLEMSDELQSILNQIDKINEQDDLNEWKLNEKGNTAILKNKNARIFKQNDHLCLSYNNKIELFDSVKELHEWLNKHNFPLPKDIKLHESIITEDEDNYTNENEKDDLRDFDTKDYDKDIQLAKTINNVDQNLLFNDQLQLELQKEENLENIRKTLRAIYSIGSSKVDLNNKDSRIKDGCMKVINFAKSLLGELFTNSKEYKALSYLCENYTDEALNTQFVIDKINEFVPSKIDTPLQTEDKFNLNNIATRNKFNEYANNPSKRKYGGFSKYIEAPQKIKYINDSGKIIEAEFAKNDQILTNIDDFRLEGQYINTKPEQNSENNIDKINPDYFYIIIRFPDENLADIQRYVQKINYYSLKPASSNQSNKAMLTTDLNMARAFPTKTQAQQYLRGVQRVMAFIGGVEPFIIQGEFIIEANNNKNLFNTAYEAYRSSNNLSANLNNTQKTDNIDIDQNTPNPETITPDQDNINIDQNTTTEPKNTNIEIKLFKDTNYPFTVTPNMLQYLTFTGNEFKTIGRTREGNKQLAISFSTEEEAQNFINNAKNIIGYSYKNAKDKDLPVTDDFINGLKCEKINENATESVKTLIDNLLKEANKKYINGYKYLLFETFDDVNLEEKQGDLYDFANNPISYDKGTRLAYNILDPGKRYGFSGFNSARKSNGEEANIQPENVLTLYKALVGDVNTKNYLNFTKEKDLEKYIWARNTIIEQAFIGHCYKLDRAIKHDANKKNRELIKEYLYRITDKYFTLYPSSKDIKLYCLLRDWQQITDASEFNNSYISNQDLNLKIAKNEDGTFFSFDKIKIRNGQTVPFTNLILKKDALNSISKNGLKTYNYNFMIPIILFTNMLLSSLIEATNAILNINKNYSREELIVELQKRTNTLRDVAFLYAIGDISKKGSLISPEEVTEFLEKTPDNVDLKDLIKTEIELNVDLENKYEPTEDDIKNASKENRNRMSGIRKQSEKAKLRKQAQSYVDNLLDDDEDEEDSETLQNTQTSTNTTANIDTVELNTKIQDIINKGKNSFENGKILLATVQTKNLLNAIINEYGNNYTKYLNDDIKKELNTLKTQLNISESITECVTSGTLGSAVTYVAGNKHKKLKETLMSMLDSKLTDDKILVEDDSPADFASGISSEMTADAASGSTTSTTSTDSSTTTSTPNIDMSNDNPNPSDTTANFGDINFNGEYGPAEDEENNNPIGMMPQPEQVIVDVLVNPDDDTDIIVKLKDTETEEIETKHLYEIDV